MVVLVTIFRLMTILLIVGYLAINLVADLPKFLIIQNLVYAIAYSLLLYLTWTSSHNYYYYFAFSFLAAFNAGRVSRSIIGPDGTIMDLAVEHVPLFTWVLAVGLLSLYLGIKGGA